MAEIKTGIFAKNVQKRLNRAQEKVLQKLGKADETKDEQFEQVVINFRRQESEGSRLQREMKSYMAAIKGMQQASINLSQSLHEVYEPDWHGRDDVMSIGKDCDALWEDFHNKVVDSTLLNLDAYLQQFPDLKTRVAKRSRKLIDYDSARHHVETLQASGMKNDRKMMKAEEELKKAQRVFDELNAGLQDELPTLWDNRVGFYINTYKSVTSLEARFHREISVLCKQLYEVMTKLGEQHSDKMFTIQGAPSDSGPLRLARTPSPPDDESPPESPDASSNHMLRPVSPGPPRPKSPSQLRKGPPVPPPPKVTPTKEVAEDQIIDLFGGEFLPAPSPSQPNERPGESLLDLDFDAFQPDESVSPIPQTAVPWDMWSANAQAAEPDGEGGFVADWSADFGSVRANEDSVSPAEAPAVELDGTQADKPGGEDEVSRWELSCPKTPNLQTGAGSSDEAESGQDQRRQSTPGLIFTNEYGEQIQDSTKDGRDKWSRSPDGSGSEYETAEEWCDGAQGGGWASADDELCDEREGQLKDMEAELVEGPANGVAADWPQTAEGTPQKREVMERNANSNVLTETQGGGAFDSDPFAETQGGGAFDSDPSAETQGGGAFDSDPSAETQGGGAFDSDPSAETQGGGAFDSDPLAETQGGGAFDSDPSAETQGGGAFDSDPSAETQGGGAFDSDPFAETQGGGAFDSDPSAEIQGGGAFDSDPFAETHGGGAFDSDPFAETQGGGAFDSDPFAETQGGGAFDSDPFAETQGGGAFDSDPFAESQGGGTFDSGPSAETQGGGAFDSDPFAETQGGGTFDSDPFAETQGGGAFDSDPFAETQGGGAFDSGPSAETQGVGAFDSAPSAGGVAEAQVPSALDLFAQTSGEGGVGVGPGWDVDPFANSFPAASSQSAVPATNTSGTTGEGTRDVNIPRIHRDPENSDMSEDEAANRRFGKLYQELDTEKEEVTNAFNGFSQDAAAPSFFADFDKMNEVNTDSNEIQEPTEEKEKPPTPPTAKGEEPIAPPAAEGVEPIASPSTDKVDPIAPPAIEEVEPIPQSTGDGGEGSGSPKEEKPASTVGSPVDVAVLDRADVNENPPDEEAKTCESEAAPSETVSAPDERKESPVTETSEKMPIPSVVIEPASSNEGDDDRDADIISPTAVSDNGVSAVNQTVKHMSPSGGVSALPDDFLYKVETMHDFEAANSDELELKRGDIVLVVPTASVEDQDAGWLTGIKESDWSTMGVGAQRGLFPENFTQRLE
ncbi:amphiphysin-like isoform X5 [Sphaeramia orbicularis]|uniref:amphiphysin-like isoform X5 n=1 Tax=Sphaeramia orbicularis TaxID=375764 RepID=UPI00117FC053|nr:amphiphysin-like isoform X5 [Sphaeramia orbicularis]